MKIDKKLIKEMVGSLDEFSLTELEYQEGDKKIKVSKAAKASTEILKGSVLTSSDKSASNNVDQGVKIKSPIIGTAYLAAEPGAKRFIKIGDKIKKGQTIMIIEAMKTMNHVPSTNDGTVKKILVNDGQPVEFGQDLVLLQ